MGLTANPNDVEFGSCTYDFLAILRQRTDGYWVDYSIYAPSIIFIKVFDVLRVQEGVSQKVTVFQIHLREVRYVDCSTLLTEFNCRSFFEFSVEI